MAKGPTTLSETDMASYRRKDWVIPLAAGLPVEEALKSEFWSHIGKKLKPFDRIELQAEDRTFIADLIVLSAGPGFAKVHMLALHKLVDDVAELEAAEDEASPVIVGWGGPSAKWRVVRRSDKAILKQGFDNKNDAQEFVLNYQRAIA